ncbi:MAG: glycosyltransferase family 4 protein [Gemmatimonadetes bacterium]|nr:glycosyltransferase family 4 protein [Gemmatimonadota bacterium]MBT7860219.1 glycosyltransferase family 4 protein [Gemmatimonadota bacterium]
MGRRPSRGLLRVVPLVMIRVAHVVPTDRIAWLLLRRRLIRLAAAGCEIHILCGRAPDSGTADGVDYEAGLTELGLQVHYLPFEREIVPWTDARTAAALYGAIRRGRYDIVHTHNPKGGLLGPPVAQMARAPHVLHTVHGFLFHDRTSGLYHVAAQAAERWTAMWSDHLLFQSEEDLAYARTHGYKKQEHLHLVGNGVDEAYFDGQVDLGAATLRQELGWKDTDLVVGTVGRVVEEKGYLEFFEMASRLADERDDVRFLIVGLFEPEQSDAVDPFALAREHGIQDRCHILQGRDDMPTLYASMDVFVLASHREGLSKSLLEATAMARPTVTCDIRGCREVVIDGETGMLVPVRDVASLHKAVADLLQDEDRRLRLGTAGRQRVVEHYTESVVAQRVMAIYTSLMAA